MKIKPYTLITSFICSFYFITQNIYAKENATLNSNKIIDSLYSVNQKNVILINEIRFRNQKKFEGEI